MGFFVVGWDEDTLETYQRTLDFCDEMKMMPMILTLAPMPGSPIYEEYLAQGRILTELPWDRYGGEEVVFRHPTMGLEQMQAENNRVMQKGFTWGRIFSRTWHTFRHRPSLGVAMNSFFTQVGMKKAFKYRLG
jgi:hypothetical protein